MKLSIRQLSISIIGALSILSANPASAASGEKSVGLRGGYTTMHKAPTAGLYFQYQFSKYFRLAPSVDYYFKKHGVDAFALNVNANVPFAVGQSEKFNLYPLAGVNFTSWNLTNVADDSSNRKNRLGLNIGGGAEYYVTPSLKLALEAKYVWVKHYDGGVFNLSIGYVF